MNIHMQRQTKDVPYLLEDKQCIQQITRPRMGKKNASGRATPSPSIVHNYVSAFTTKLKVKKVNFEINIADRKATNCI